MKSMQVIILILLFCKFVMLNNTIGPYIKLKKFRVLKNKNVGFEGNYQVQVEQNVSETDSYRKQVVLNTNLETLECIQILSAKTEKNLVVSQITKKNKIFVKASYNLFLYNTWNLQHFGESNYTISIPNLPYYFGLDTNCLNIEPFVRLTVVSAELQSNFYLTVNIKDQKRTSFSMSVCDRCVFVDTDNDLKLTSNCDNRDSVFFLKDKRAHSVCSVLKGFYISTRSDEFISLTELTHGQPLITKTDPIQSNKWEIKQYKTFYIIRESDNNKFYWHIDETGAVIISNNSIVTDKGKFSIETAYTDDESIAKLVIKNSGDFIKLDPNTKSLIVSSEYTEFYIRDSIAEKSNTPEDGLDSEAKEES